jgi:hypothetical protein
MTKQVPLMGVNMSPPVQPDLPKVVDWLMQNKLTQTGNSYDVAEKDKRFVGLDQVLAAPTKRRVSKLTQEQIKKKVKEYKDKTEPLAGIQNKDLYGAMKKPREIVRALNFDRLPMDAMAFYRSFHYLPYEQWGIYLLVDELVKYHGAVSKIIGPLNAFSPSTLMHYILFEIFHHEFFHHIAEATATTLEILAAAMGTPKPFYLDYRRRSYEGKELHKYAPLEEALANAYAYNAFSFINRVGVGCKTSGVKVFQAAMKRYWIREPAGYRDAHNYVGGQHIKGGAELLGLMLDKPEELLSTPLMRVAKSVMPSGFSAYVAKPDIPTYLVGSAENIVMFYKLVPTPNEAYSRLYWPYDTSEIDKYIKDERAKEKEAKKKEKEKKQ